MLLGAGVRVPDDSMLQVLLLVETVVIVHKRRLSIDVFLFINVLFLF